MSLSTLDTSTASAGFSLGSTPDSAALLSGAATSVTTPTVTPPPAPGDPNWTTYWQQKDPAAWSLVWDSQVPKNNTSGVNKTFTDNLKTGQPVYFSFDIKESLALDDHGKPVKNDMVTMTEEQKENTRKALQELSNVTGVKFVEKSGVKGGLILGLGDLSEGSDKESTMGQHYGAKVTVADAKGNKTTQYQQTITVNKVTYAKTSLEPGTGGFETLLHELGHAAGLDDAKFELGKKYPQYDDTKYTLMSYEDAAQTNRKTYGELDKRAFQALYPVDKRPATPPQVVSAEQRSLLSAAGVPLEDDAFLEDGLLTGADEDEWEYEDNLAGPPSSEPGSSQNQDTVVAGGSSSSEPGSSQDYETIVEVEADTDGYKESRVSSAEFKLGNPNGVSTWPVQADPALLLATTPAMGGTAAWAGALPDMFAGADALKRVLAQG